MNVVEGVNSLKTIFSLIDASTLKELPLLNKLYLFFDSELDEINLDLKELYNYGRTMKKSILITGGAGFIGFSCC